jgi:hypothetical protein
MRTATKRKPKRSRHQFHDSLKMRGFLEYVLRDARTGEIVRQGRKENTVQFGGRGWALKRIVSSDAQVLSAIAIGSSSTAPTSSDNSLVAYTTIAVFGTTGLTTSTNAACTFTGAVSFDSNGTWTNSSQIGEFGIYNSNASGGGAQVFNRLNTTPYINFGTSNTLSLTITITN